MMPDREKVMRGLECCCTHIFGMSCGNCPYEIEQREDEGISVCTSELAYDALALLKEQEAKPPTIMQDIEGIWLTCSMCGHKLRPILAMKMDTYFPKFCSECGQAVKWE